MFIEMDSMKQVNNITHEAAADLKAAGSVRVVFSSYFGSFYFGWQAN
jgi:hypothetical protein